MKHTPNNLYAQKFRIRYDKVEGSDCPNNLTISGAFYQKTEIKTATNFNCDISVTVNG